MMNLKKFLSWPPNRTIRQSWVPDPPITDEVGPEVTGQQTAPLSSTGNVVFLPAANAEIERRPAVDSSSFEHSAPEPARRKGLIDAEELQAFWRDNYFGLGRHNGAQHHSAAAMELGCQAIIAKLQN